MIHLVDVGARDGIDPRWKRFYDQLRVTAFEPDTSECERMRRKTWPYQMQVLPHALGALDNEDATLYITEQPGCSSLLRPNHKLCDQFHYGKAMRVAYTLPVRLCRMDTVLDEQPDVLKIDTQGTELDILMGAGKLLDRTIAVECEVEFVSQYEHQALFGDVDAFMRKAGFELRGIRRTYWRNLSSRYTHAAGGQLIHGDALWLRMDALNNPVGHTILSAYRQHDLLAAFGAHHLIPKPSKWRQFIGKLDSNRELRRFIDSCRPVTASDWHDPDFF